MNSLRSFAASVACLVALGMSAVQAAPVTDVVFGNLGASGTNSAGSFNADVGDGSVPFLNAAQGFTATSPNLTVTSVGLWLFGDGSIPTTVGIFADNAGSPAASPAFTSSTLNVGAESLYQFSFSGATLTNGASYWIRPVTSGEVSWYLASGAPTAQNSSGYVFNGAKQNTGSGWTASSTSDWSVTVSAVPEPSTYAMAAIGAGVAGLMGWRRRKVAVAV